MNDIDFETQLNRVDRAAEVVNKLPKNLHVTAFQILFGEVAIDDSMVLPSSTAPKDSRAPAENTAVNDDDAKQQGTATTSRKSRRSGSNGPKPAPQDRELELFPEGKVSFKEFSIQKNPSNNNEKYAVSVWWLLRVLELPIATVAQVVTCYMAAGWALPKDVANGASQSRKAGYLSSAKAEDLKLASLGINLVNTELPRPVS